MSTHSSQCGDGELFSQM